MAKISGNTAMKGARGRLGEFYYRIRYSFQEVCRMPRKSTKPPTEAQLAQRELLKEANIYAKKLKTDPEMRTYYEKMAKKKKMTNAYHCALSHYMTCPRLRQMDFSEYTGSSGDTIRFQATAWKSVSSVVIKIMDSGGAIVESGAAEKGDYYWWSYTLHQSIPGWQSGTVVVEITDDLGHVRIQKEAIPA